MPVIRNMLTNYVSNIDNGYWNNPKLLLDTMVSSTFPNNLKLLNC